MSSRMRVRCAWSKFRELSPIITSRGASMMIKGKIYKACVHIVMVYGSETWPMKVKDKQRLERTEKMIVRWLCGVTLRNRLTSEELRNRLSIEAVTEIVRHGSLRWFGHVERKADDDCVKSVIFSFISMTPASIRPRSPDLHKQRLERAER